MEKITFHTEQRKISDLVPAPYNPRRMTEEQAKQLTSSLEKFDLAEIPVINTDNTILAGHQRLKVLHSLGRGSETIDVRVPSRKLTEEECKEYNIRSNRNTGEWDFDLLANNFDVPMLLDIGFTELELGLDVIGDSDDDEVPEVTYEPRTVRGDIYILGNHRVMCGDSINMTEVEYLMQGDKADMVFTDPPYLMNFSGSVHKDGSKSHNASHGAIKNDKMTPQGGMQFLQDVMRVIKRFSRGPFYITFYRLGIDWIMNACTAVGLKWRNLIIWKKNNHNLSNSDYKSLYEPMIVGWADDYVPVLYGWNQDHTYYGKKSEKDVWEQSVPSIWEIDRTIKNDLHPTMKPVELVARAIVNSSKQEDTVLDLFLGSGSTVIACEKTSRSCVGMELDTHYVDIIVARWCKYTGNTKVIKNGIEIDWVV